MLYLIDDIASGLHLLYKMTILKEIGRKPISLHPGLATRLTYSYKLSQSFAHNAENFQKSVKVDKWEEVFAPSQAVGANVSQTCR